MVAVGEFGQMPQQADIGLDLLSDVGAQDLDHDFGTVVQSRRMHLGDRCRSQRRFVEQRKQFADRLTQLRFDDLLRDDTGKRRDLVAQLRQFIGDIRRQ